MALHASHPESPASKGFGVWQLAAAFRTRACRSRFRKADLQVCITEKGEAAGLIVDATKRQCHDRLSALPRRLTHILYFSAALLHLLLPAALPLSAQSNTRLLVATGAGVPGHVGFLLRAVFRPGHE